MGKKTSSSDMDIENRICSYFGVCPEVLGRERRTDRRTTDCLHFIWYMRHYAEGRSHLQLAREYGRTPRNVKKAISKIRDGIASQPYYAGIYRAIKECAEPPLTGDPAQGKK